MPKSTCENNWNFFSVATCFSFFLLWLPVFFLFFYNGPELVAGIDPGMALTPFQSSILDEMRFKPTTF